MLRKLGFSKVLDLILGMTERKGIEALDPDYMTYVRGFEDDDGRVFLEQVDLDEVANGIR